MSPHGASSPPGLALAGAIQSGPHCTEGPQARSQPPALPEELGAWQGPEDHQHLELSPPTLPQCRGHVRVPLSTLPILTGPLGLSHATSGMEFHLESSGDSLWSGRKEICCRSLADLHLFSLISAQQRLNRRKSLLSCDVKKRNPNNDSVRFHAEEDLWIMQNRNISLSL